MNINKIYEFIESMSEEDFFEYMSPTSYYNNTLIFSICSDQNPRIEKRKLLEIYFFLKENEEDISECVFEKLSEYLDIDEEIDNFSVDWNILVFFLAGLDYKKIVSTLKVGKIDTTLEKLIQKNEDFDRKNYFILNDLNQEKSFYTEDLLAAIYYLLDSDRNFDIESLIKNPKFRDDYYSLEIGDLILSENFKKLERKDFRENSEFFSNIRSEYYKIKRTLSLDSLFENRKIIKFKNFNFSHRK
jgi:hypothetical protein